MHPPTGADNRVQRVLRLSPLHVTSTNLPDEHCRSVPVAICGAARSSLLRRTAAAASLAGLMSPSACRGAHAYNASAVLAYREIRPSAALLPYVRCFWSLRGALPAGGSQEGILPDGSFELVFHIGKPFRRDSQIQPRALLVGEIRRPTLLETSDDVDVYGVRFTIGGAAAFLRPPMKEFRDGIHDAEDLFRRAQFEQMMEACADRAVDRLDTVLRDSLAPRNHEHLLAAAVAHIRKAGGNLRVGELASRLGTTERTLERAFEASAGMSPKLVARVIRFTRALSGNDDDLGYYDDPHRIHEFRSFSGTTPLSVGKPVWSTLTLVVTGTPCSGGRAWPRARAASAVSAAARASGSSTRTTALIVGLTACRRFRTESTASRADAWPVRMRRARSVASYCQSSMLVPSFVVGGGIKGARAAGPLMIMMRDGGPCSHS